MREVLPTTYDLDERVRHGPTAQGAGAGAGGSATQQALHRTARHGARLAAGGGRRDGCSSSSSSSSSSRAGLYRAVASLGRPRAMNELLHVANCTLEASHASRLTLPHTHDQPATATAHRQRVHYTTTRHVREWPTSTSDSHDHRQKAANGHHTCAGCRATSGLRVSDRQESASRFHEIFLSCRPSSSASIQYNPPSSLPPTFSRIPPSCCFISLSSASPTPTMLSSRLSRTVSILQELDHSINPILTSSSDPAARGLGRPSHPRHQIALRRHVCARLRRGC
jgi:hypothetical protein